MRSGPRVPRIVVLDHLAIGGGTTVIATLAASLLARGLPVEVVAIARIWDDADERLPPGSLTVLGARGHLSSLLRLRRHLIAALEPNSVFLSIGEYSALLAVLARLTSRRLRRMKIVIAEHQPHSLAELLRDRRGPIGTLVPPVVRSLRRRVDASICLSEQQRHELIESDLATERRSVVIANPCVLPVASEAVISQRLDRLATGEDVRLLAIGSYNAAKNHAMALRVLAELDTRYSLTIVGNGDADPLRVLADELGVSDRVEFRRAEADVVRVMDDHDIFVLPSRYESFGLVVIEAIVRGLPVVATACNSTLPEIAAGCDSLRLIPVDDDAAFQMAVIDCASTLWDSEKLLAHAERLAAVHDPEHAVEQHLALFATLDREAGLSS
jgi:glycosyltransferase involved in cell wall biosynthesis